MFLESFPCLLGQHGNCSTAQQHVEHFTKPFLQVAALECTLIIENCDTVMAKVSKLVIYHNIKIFCSTFGSKVVLYHNFNNHGTALKLIVLKVLSLTFILNLSWIECLSHCLK